LRLELGQLLEVTGVCDHGGELFEGVELVHGVLGSSVSKSFLHNSIHLTEFNGKTVRIRHSSVINSHCGPQPFRPNLELKNRFKSLEEFMK
jgi:predicted RNA-binding protein